MVWLDRSLHGTIYSYDKSFDAVNTKNEKPLQTIDMVKYNTTTSEDPVILEVSMVFCYNHVQVVLVY